MSREYVKSAIGQEKSLEKYLGEIADHSPLDPTEEVDLARRVRKGEPGALEKLIKANLRFVISVAKQYQGYGLPLEDLIGEGNLGLMKAAQKFDETRGFKFISYAVWWIRQSILQALSEHPRAVRLPMNRVDAIAKVGKVFERLHKQFEREPTLGEVADCLEMNDSELADVINTSGRHLSLNQPFQTGETNSLLDVLENDPDTTPDQVLLDESLKQEISRVLVSLHPREAEIIRMSFGLGGERPLTLQDIGEYFQLSRERIRQIKEIALRRMRHFTRSEPLKQYLAL